MAKVMQSLASLYEIWSAWVGGEGEIAFSKSLTWGDRREARSHLLEIQLRKSTQSRDLLKEFGAVSESVHFRRNSTSCQESSIDLVDEVTKTRRSSDKLRMGIQGSGRRWGRRTKMWVLTGLVLRPDGDIMICASLPYFLFRGCLLPKCQSQNPWL